MDPKAGANVGWAGLESQTECAAAVPASLAPGPGAPGKRPAVDAPPARRQDVARQD